MWYLRYVPHLYWEFRILEFQLENVNCSLSWCRISDLKGQEILTDPELKIQDGGTEPKQ